MQFIFLFLAFGYISYTTYNIGDDVQAEAAKQFLPENAVPIDREFVGVFQNDTKIPTLINGWFMHTKDFYWYRPDVPAPEKSWPPAPCIEPLITSIHLADGFLPYAFTDEAVEYLKAHAPIGARDLNTLHEFQSRGIESYFSGCLTLTLNNDSKKRNNIIYAVDLDDECYHYLKARVRCPVVRLTHILNHRTVHDPLLRQAYVKKVLQKYKQAKAVVTIRLHAAMPCLAYETPILFVSEANNRRIHGLRQLTHHCSRNEFLRGEFDFDFNNPPSNPPEYRELRNNLIDIVESWVEKNQSLT